MNQFEIYSLSVVSLLSVRVVCGWCFRWEDATGERNMEETSGTKQMPCFRLLQATSFKLPNMVCHVRLYFRDIAFFLSLGDVLFFTFFLMYRKPEVFAVIYAGQHLLSKWRTFIKTGKKRK